MSVMNRVIASKNRQALTSLNDGKKAMSFGVYKTLCNVLHQGEGENFIFAHAFLTIEWNLMEKSNNFVNMHIKFIQWRLYYLIFYF